MKVLILRSYLNTGIVNRYSVKMDVLYANRLIGHLTDKNYCKACQDKCRQCRSSYNLDYSRYIVGILDFPAILPAIVDDPEEHLPEKVPDHDVLIAVSVNEEILLAFIKRFPLPKGLIVPIEGSDWISPNYIKEIKKVCAAKAIECEFPKPFCSFSPKGIILNEFRRQFRIGRPEVEYTVENGVIEKARVRVSAPCGATYYTCRGLEGQNVTNNLQFIIDNRLSAYPCTASHALDREFNDSITHKAVKLQRSILDVLQGNVKQSRKRQQ